MTDHFGDTFFVTKDGSNKNEIVGFMLGFASPIIKGYLFIWQIAVSPKVQGQGVGSKLLKYTIDYCRKMDACSKIIATVETTNKASQYLFEKFNFSIASKKFKAPYQELISCEGKEAITNYYNSGTDEIFYLLDNF
ncbi:MAG: GNAT family N-acetyltransferase [Candidatus Cloacimonadota bacterium]|nr:GNAT family N-acetyltransferase [Candidatus Cloacimonadota bacterium]